MIAIFWLAACSDAEEFQIEIEHKKALHDEAKATVQRKLDAIENGRPYDEPGENNGSASGYIIGVCTCTYNSLSSPPTSCSDPRCGPGRYWHRKYANYRYHIRLRVWGMVHAVKGRWLSPAKAADN